MLAVIALTLAALFSGAALHVAAVEYPARGTLAPRDRLAQWQAAHARRAMLQAPLAALAGAAGFAVWFQWREMWFWLAGAMLMWGAVAFTFAVMRTLTDRLKATAPEATDPAALDRWWWLHMARTGIGLMATAVYAVALIDLVRR